MNRDDDTAEVVEPTRAIAPAPASVVHAWGDEPEEAWRHDRWSLLRRLADGRLVTAVIAAVAVAAVSVAATLALTAPHGEHFSIRPPVEVLPPPAPPPAAAPAPKAAPPQAPPPKASPPPVRPAPRVRAAPPVQPFPPAAEGRFADALRGDDGMWLRNPARADAQAGQLCSDLAGGGSVDDYIRGTLRKSPQLTPQEATRAVWDAVDAYCPQYGDR